MKRSVLAMALAVAAIGAQAANLESQSEKSGYAVGVDFGSALSEFNSDDKELINFNAVVVGFRDAFEQKELRLTDDEMSAALEALSKEVQVIMQEKIEAAQKESVEVSKKFLEENAKKEGVKTTDSGLQYVVKTEGTGKQPSKDDTVKVTYEGRLIDGTVFDKSEEPVSFGVSQVIDGWVEGIQLMKEGGEYTFFIPSELGYGEFGQAWAGILPGAALVFDVKLVEVVAAPKPEPVSDISTPAIEEGKVEVVEVRDSKAAEEKPAAAEEAKSEEKPAEAHKH